MARSIYEIKLNNRFFPALSSDEALEMVDPETAKVLMDSSFTVSEVVKEEHTMKLFVAAKTMSDIELFEVNEIEAAVRALAFKLGYYTTADDVTECVLTWVERFMDVPLSELQEWIIG